MQDDLGDRMKRDYENRTRFYLPRRTYTVLRVDGRNFHSYTRGLARPFDFALMEDMDKTAIALCANCAGSAFAYIQSDEISVLLTDFASPGTEAWFDGNIQKISSIAAGIATAAFSRARWQRRLQEAGGTLDSAALKAMRDASFDARVFTIPDPVEVGNYFIWRQQDATRNSVSMAAHALYTTAELQGKSWGELQEALWQRGVNWNDYPAGCKRGRMIVRAAYKVERTFTHGETGQTETARVERHRWQAESPPVFTQNREYLAVKIPVRS